MAPSAEEVLESHLNKFYVMGSPRYNRTFPGKFIEPTCSVAREDEIFTLCAKEFVKIEPEYKRIIHTKQDKAKYQHSIRGLHKLVARKSWYLKKSMGHRSRGTAVDEALLEFHSKLEDLDVKTRVWYYLATVRNFWKDHQSDEAQGEERATEL
ncbi:MAG: hypothetical protein LQ352_007090 [Teloschistes flavicans]|nr:MAG: hypothetical protein LQ352_007090 [Teloschistes flavicans]